MQRSDKLIFIAEHNNNNSDIESELKNDLIVFLVLQGIVYGAFFLRIFSQLMRIDTFFHLINCHVLRLEIGMKPFINVFWTFIDAVFL